MNVGNIEERKNLMLAVQALKYIPSDVHLVAIGRKTPYVNKIMDYVAENSLGHRVHSIHDLPHKDLPAVYQLATLFVYPSRFEGFGIPIIEAMHSQLPVIAATGSCLEEAGGKVPYVDPDAMFGMAEAMNRILEDPALREKIIASGNIDLQRFQENILADSMRNVYFECFERTESERLVSRIFRLKTIESRSKRPL
ncbi:MAG: glycosyltransferase [Coprobacter fastidiosus]